MAKSLGSSGTVEISSNGSSYTSMGEVMSAELPAAINAVDCTTNDSGGDKEYLAGDFDSTFTFEIAYDPADAGQISLFNAFDGKTTMYFRYRPTVGATLNQWVMQAIITELPVPASHEELITLSVTTQITGGITRSAQT